MSDLTFCSACGTHATSLGTLGQREHFRCDGCGFQFSIPTDKKKARDLRQARQVKQSRLNREEE